MPMGGERNGACDTRNGIDVLSTVCGWVKRWMQWGSRGAVLRRKLTTYVDMPFLL